MPKGVGRCFFTPAHVDALKNMCRGKYGLAGEIEDSAASIAGTSVDLMDSIERVFDCPSWETFVLKIPRSGSPRIRQVLASFFTEAVRAPDRAGIHASLELLVSADVIRTMSLCMKPRMNLPLLGAYIRLLCAAAMRHPAEARSNTALVSDLVKDGSLLYHANLVSLFPKTGPQFFAYLSSRLVFFRDGELIARLLAFEYTEDFLWLADICNDREVLFPLILEPVLDAFVAERAALRGLPSPFAPASPGMLPPPADPVSAADKISAFRRLKHTRNIVGFSGWKSEKALNRFAQIRPLLDLIQTREKLSQLCSFADAFWSADYPSVEYLWERLSVNPQPYRSRLAFLSGPGFARFTADWKANASADAKILLADLLVTVIEEPSHPEITPALCSAARAQIAEPNHLFLWRQYWKTRSLLYACVLSRGSPELCRRTLLRIILFELFLIGQNKIEERTSRIAVRIDELHIRFCSYAEELEASTYKNRGVLSHVGTKLFYDVLHSLTKRKMEAAPKIYGGYLDTILGVVHELNLFDEFLANFNDVPSNQIGEYFTPILECIVDRLKKPGKEFREAFARVIDKRWRFRLEFAQAYRYIMDCVFPVLGGYTILSDEETNWARTDGHVIYLPEYISFFDDPAKTVPFNRNLSMYIALALHEAGHIIGGTFAFNLMPVYESVDYPHLLHRLFNLFEDFRVERYLSMIHLHPQTQDLLDFMNAFLYANVGSDRLSNFLFALFSQTQSYWPDLILDHPEVEEEYKELSDIETESNTFPTLGALGAWCIKRMLTMDILDPTAAMRLSLVVYTILVPFARRADEESSALNSQARVPMEQPASADGDGGGVGAAEAAEGLRRLPVQVDRDALSLLSREFNADPRSFYRSLGLPVHEAAFEERELHRTKIDESDGQTEQEEASSSEPDERRGQASIPDKPDKPGKPNDSEAGQGGSEPCIFMQPDYTESGIVKWHRKKEESSREEPAEAQVKPYKREKRKRRKRARPQQRTRTRKLSRSDRLQRKAMEARHSCRTVDVHKIDYDFLELNSEYTAIWKRISELLYRYLKDGSRNDRPELMDEGDIDIDELIEVLVLKKQGESFFLEDIEEHRKTLSVVIGLDASGSTAGSVGPTEGASDELSTDTILDIEKHFALILSRALGILAESMEVFGFNSEATTTVYRADPCEALTSFESDMANRDGDFIRYCTDTLLSMSGEIKCFFLITDGRPSSVDYFGKEAMVDTIEACRAAKKQGILIAYLNIDSTESSYIADFKGATTWTRHFNDPSQLLEAAPDLLRKVLAELS